MDIASNGSTFNCRIDGPDGAPWITLSHGLATDLSMWDEITEALQSRYRVLRYDARGHGDSAAPEGDYSLDQLGTDVVGILDALGIERTHFVGLSMGGMVGLGLALDHPDRLSSAIICDARAAAPSEYRDAWAQRSQMVRSGGIETMVEPSVTRWFTSAFQKERPEALDRMRAMVRRTSVAGYCGCAAALQGLDYKRRLGEIQVPMLFVVGTQDQGAPPAAMREMHAATPGSRYVEIPNAGHISNIEQPQLFAEVILEFLARLERTHQ